MQTQKVIYPSKRIKIAQKDWTIQVVPFNHPRLGKGNWGRCQWEEQTIYISNNLPYITKLEYGGYPKNPKGGSGKTVNGYSKQAPEGMVGVTLANNEAIFDSAVRSVRK